MTNIDDLRDQLERLGRRPVPMPRPEFADKLLRDLQSGETSTDVLPMPTPIGSRERRKRVPARLVAMGSIAAALVLVIGLIGLTTGGSTEEPTFGFEGGSTLAGSTRVENVTPKDKGWLGEGVKDGLALVTCRKGGQFTIADGTVHTCQEGQVLQVEVRNQRIVSVGEPPAISSVEVASSATEAPTTTEAPSTSLPTTATTRSTATTTPSTAGPTESTTTTTKPPPSSGPTTATTADPGKVVLAFEAERGDKQVRFSWNQYTGADFGRYVMVRSSGLTIGFPPANEDEEIWSSDDASSVRYMEAELPLGVEVVRYQLFVVDKAGKILAQSEVVKVELSLGPSTSSTSEPVTTVTSPDPTSTTSSSTGSTS
jgi:hypothetical protein